MGGFTGWSGKYFLLQAKSLSSMASDFTVYPEKVDITNCDKEPIHIIGKVQSHGFLIACDATTLRISQVSSNTLENSGYTPDDLLGNSLSLLTGPEQERIIREQIAQKTALIPEEIVLDGKQFIMLPHLSEGHLILDFEPLERVHDPGGFQRQLSRILNNLRAANDVNDLCDAAAFLTRELFGYDRVMVYRFDEDWNGEVIAEQKKKSANSWLGLHYPATDIPSQSRQMFFKHRVRMITNVQDVPVPVFPQISPVNNKPLNLSRSSLRGVSPIHIEYLQNMEVGASLTAAIIVKGKLWGLIACHHNAGRFIDYYQRESCHFLTQMLSNELSLRETNSFLQHTEVSGKLREKLVEQMREAGNLINALSRQDVKYTDLISCGGGAVIIQGELSLTGGTPSKEDVLNLIRNFLDRKKEMLFVSKDLSRSFPEAERYKKTASGILSLRIAESNYIIWFRPEQKQTVSWGGNPEKKALYDEDKKRLSPRKSFEKWTQELEGISKPWQDFDRSTAKAFGDNISYFLLEKQRNEIENLNAKLLEANKELELFSYGLSHDLRAPLRGITGYLKIINEDYRDHLGEEGNIFLQNSLHLTDKMDKLIEDILSYSRLNHGELRESEFSPTDLVHEVLTFLNVQAAYPSCEILVEENMPLIKGDRRMLFQVWSNLIQNACLYSSKEENPKVEIGAISGKGKNVYFVKDNGIGIASEYKEKIFATFSRLSGENYKGSGIGLALVKRVVLKHNGEVWVESEPGIGSAFYFSI